MRVLTIFSLILPALLYLVPNVPLDFILDLDLLLTLLLTKNWIEALPYMANLLSALIGG